MATTRTAIGRVQPVYRGNYSSSATYYKLDNVFWNNSTWVCKVDNTTNYEPTIEHNDKWQKVAGQGSTGSFGTPTASATYLSPGADPTVTVTASGPDTGKIFNFDFGIPAGPTGPIGPIGVNTVSAEAISVAPDSNLVVTTSLSGDTTKNLNFRFEIPAASGQGVQKVDGIGANASNEVWLYAVPYVADPSRILSEEQKAQARVNIGTVAMPSNMSTNQYLHYNNSGNWVGRSLYEVPFGDTIEDVNKFLKKGENDSLTWQTIYQIPAAPSGTVEGVPLVKASGESHAVTWGSVISSSDIDSIFNEN